MPALETTDGGRAFRKGVGPAVYREIISGAGWWGLSNAPWSVKDVLVWREGTSSWAHRFDR